MVQRHPVDLRTATPTDNGSTRNADEMMPLRTGTRRRRLPRGSLRVHHLVLLMHMMLMLVSGTGAETTVELSSTTRAQLLTTAASTAKQRHSQQEQRRTQQQPEKQRQHRSRKPNIYKNNEDYNYSPFLQLTGKQLQRRHLAEKYQPDKANFSCTLYFANGTSTTITAPLPNPNGNVEGNSTVPITEAESVVVEQAQDGDSDSYDSNYYDNEDHPPPCRLDGDNNIIPPPPEGFDTGVSTTSSPNGDEGDADMATDSQRPVDDDGAEESEAESPPKDTIGNLVKTQISVALPPDPYLNGMPRGVAMAVTKLFNMTSNLRHEDMQGFLDIYNGHQQGWNQVSKESLSNILTFVQELQADIPTILPLEQTVLFFIRYHRGFQRQRVSHGLFWELVHKDTHAKPLYRKEREGHEPTYTVEYVKEEPIDTTEHPELADKVLSYWWLHSVRYRCYRRDARGHVYPLLDPTTLNLIERQLNSWLEFHVNVSYQLLETLQLKEQAFGVAMPGQEHDIFIDSSAWQPLGQGGNENDYPGNDYSRPPGADEGNKWRGEGTYNKPLLTSESVLLETAREKLGLALLVVTVVGSVFWSVAASQYKTRQKEQAVWGAALGTEQALQELLNVGWRIHEQPCANGDEKTPNQYQRQQVLEIYKKTKDGMGYRDDDSLLQGGTGDLQTTAAPATNVRVQ